MSGRIFLRNWQNEKGLLMNFRMSVFAFLSIVICLFTGSGISYAALEDGLVSAWTFDDGQPQRFSGRQ